MRPRPRWAYARKKGRSRASQALSATDAEETRSRIMTMKHMRPLLFALPLLLAAAPRAQTPPSAAVQTRFVLEPGEHDLRQVFVAAGRYLGRNYLVADGEVPGTGVAVTLTTRVDVGAEGCESIVANLAYSKGLAVTALDRERGLWEVVNLYGPRRGVVEARAIEVTHDELAKLRSMPTWVTTTVAARHASATMIAQTLRPFFASNAGGLNLGTAGNDRLIVLSGMAVDVARAVDMIAKADLPAPLPKVEEDRLANLERRVRELEAQVRELGQAKAADAVREVRGGK
ncbi:MAG: hypothetical protein R3F56_16695 [Planctomycetota bacterium]